MCFIKVDLSYIYIKAEGAIALANTLRANKLVTTICNKGHLDLSYNDIGAEGTKAISNALKVNKHIIFIGNAVSMTSATTTLGLKDQKPYRRLC
jgi:hypothetical protein